jgi:alkanesulfonate monooxygenase SsuD/methylene tetrahydromethanopterin reductase-like flavin-dependent oxidoreductase (luciferase family)
VRFGIYVEMQCPPGKSHYRLAKEVLEQIVHAEQCGFDTYSLIEHYFYEQFGISANPVAMFAAAAQRTHRIRFRTALHVVPLHNPMVLASQIASAVHLTDGRYEAGVGRGHAWVYVKAGVPLEESRPRYEEALEIMELGWRKPSFSYEGRFWKVKDVTINPRLDPFPPPQLWTGGTSPQTYPMAGSRGWGMMVPPLLPFDVLREGLTAYAEAARAAGHEPRVMYIRPVYVEDDPIVARREYEEHLKNFIAFNANPVYSLHAPEMREELNQKGFQFYTSGALESLESLTWEQLTAGDDGSGIAFVGSAEEVADKVVWLFDELAIDEFAMLSNLGGIPPWKAMKIHERFAGEVMPLVKRKSRRWREHVAGAHGRDG